MKKEKKSKHFLEKAHYEGGSKAMSKFVDEHLKYPKEAQENGIKGTVIIRYTINYQGDVIETKVISGIGYGCDEEAQRVVKLLKFQVGRYRNIKIQFHKTIKIHFHGQQQQKKSPDKVKPTNDGIRQITYSIASSSNPKITKQPKKQSKSYSYTISIKK